MSLVDNYLAAAERPNTRRSYASAIRHFEVEWGGLLPATADTVMRYLADHASILSMNTLRHRLAALARWHQEQGFPDPTKALAVRQVLKGIRALHPAQEKRAKPLELEILEQTSNWLENAAQIAKQRGDHAAMLRHTRDRTLLLLGFWRGFRADELVSLQIEFLRITSGDGMICYLPRSKTDRQLEGRQYACPALSRLCPVAATEHWLACSGLRSGPLFPGIDRWGHVATTNMAAGSVIPLLRNLLSSAGIPDAAAFSSHSLRRGFANWASSSGWELKQLMEYVGWRDINSAMRYLDSAKGMAERFEKGLPPASELNTAIPTALPRKSNPTLPTTNIAVSVLLTRFTPGGRGLTNAQRLIEQTCLKRYAMQRLDEEGRRFELQVPGNNREALDEALYALLDDMHRIAGDNQCFLEATCHDPATDTYWD